jgi:hypothetical protein
MIDLVSKPGVQVTEGVVGECGKVKNGVDADEIATFDIAKILVQTGDFHDIANEAILSKEVAVESNYFMVRLSEHPDQN